MEKEQTTEKMDLSEGRGFEGNGNKKLSQWLQTGRDEGGLYRKPSPQRSVALGEEEEEKRNEEEKEKEKEEGENLLQFYTA